MKGRIVLMAAVVAAAALAVVGVVGAGAKSAAKDSQSLFAVMNGKKEVSPTGEKRAGDLNGRGSFSAIFDGNELCYGISVKNIDDPVAAHIHKGSPKVAGPVVQPLQQPATGDPGASSDCVEVDPSLARAIQKNPAKYYVNVHTGDFPGGAVRGQLFGKSR